MFDWDASFFSREEEMARNSNKESKRKLVASFMYLWTDPSGDPVKLYSGIHFDACEAKSVEMHRSSCGGETQQSLLFRDSNHCAVAHSVFHKHQKMRNKTIPF